MHNEDFTINGGDKVSLNKSEKIRMVSVLAVSTLMMLISMLFFAFGVGKPYLGIDLTLTTRGWVVESVDTNGLASQMGIKAGDEPVEINGQPADTFLEQYKTLGTVLGPVFQELAVVDTNGQQKVVNLSTGSASLQSLMQQCALLFISVILWLVSFYVFLQRPKNVAAMLLCLFGAVFGLSLSGSIAGTIGVPAAVQLQIIATVIAPWLLLHFFLVLPEENARLRRSPFIYVIYLPAVVTLIFLPLVGWREGLPVPWFRTLRLLEAAVGLLGTVVVAVFNYYRSRLVKTKQQMRIILLSSMAALVPLLLLNIIPFAIFRESHIPPGVSILFIGFIPLGMGYAVVAQRLMDIDVVIRRGIVYALITLVMSGVLSTVLFAAVAFPEAFGNSEKILLALAAGLLAAFLFGPIKNRTEIVVDRLFYKDRYDYRQIIDALSNSLKLLKDPTEISRVIVGTSVRTLNLTGGCLFIKVSGYFEVGAGEGNLGTGDMLDRLSDLVWERNRQLEFPNAATAQNPKLSFVIPLVSGEKELGLLYLSHKTSRQEFSANDLYLLQGIASVGAMALHSAMLIRDVSIRDTFVSIASHELRTPLTAVIGYSDLLLRRDPPEPTKKQWLQTVLDAGLKMAEMADDLLDVSRIRSGKIALKIEKTILPPLLSEQAIAAGSLTDKHNIIMDIAPDLLEVFVDRTKFNQILANLLNNAVKYSPKGGRITISARNELEENRVVVSVADEGIGICPEDKEFLFKTFHRIQREETITIRGIGLGLYIVKEWTEAMNGKVWLESELNKGSTFYISVPIKLPEKKEHGS